MSELLKHSNAPTNEAYYLRAMANESRASVGHTKEGQIHANRLDRIANIVEAAVRLERENAKLRELAKALLAAINPQEPLYHAYGMAAVDAYNAAHAVLYPPHERGGGNG